MMIFLALARFKASIVSNKAIILSFTGSDSECIKRHVSSTRGSVSVTEISPSENRLYAGTIGSRFRILQTVCVRSALEQPATIFISYCFGGAIDANACVAALFAGDADGTVVCVGSFGRDTILPVLIRLSKSSSVSGLSW